MAMHHPGTFRRRLRRASIACALLLGASRVEAQPPVTPLPIKQVLVLQTQGRGNLTLDRFTAEFRVVLDERVDAPLNVVQLVVGPTGFVRASEKAIVDYIRSMYASRSPPHLVMTVGGPAAQFARKYRHQLFPNQPILYAATDARYLRDVPLDDNEAVVSVNNDLPRLVDDILQVLPETRQIFMVTGAGPIGRFMRPELEEGFARFGDRLEFSWSDRMSLPEILERVSQLPPRSVILFQTFGTDARGGTYTHDEVIAALYARANAPLFAMQSPYLGRGIVGGSLLDIDFLARRSANIAGRILAGESPATMRPPPQLLGDPIYDWRELKRWHIPESRLPVGSIVRFRPPSLWAEHRLAVVATLAALALQGLLITLLLFERRGRQHAEYQSRTNLDLAADANRRATVSALTTSIGHELGQPLSAIAHNAQALQLLVEARRASPEATGEILADIQSEAGLATQIIARHRTMLRSHQLQRKPTDVHAVIHEALALVAHDMRTRQIETTLELSPVPCVVEGDQVLLAQVLVNLVRNSMDALADAPFGERKIIIRTIVRPTEVAIAVCDTGCGLSAEVVGSLFSPFVTTKAHGLGIGLAIAQRIVEAHAGSIVAEGSSGRGATFTITLPRDAGREESQQGWVQQIQPEHAV